MKTLSIQQPWPWAILNLGKDVENRTWPTKVRGKFLIHASKKIDKYGYWFLGQMKYHTPREFLTGGIVGLAEICDCVSSCDSEWFFGEWGFILRKPIALPFYPCKGKLGFFDVEYPDLESYVKDVK